MKYTLRQLEIFQAAAQHQNISRAAEMLSMSQSAASGALKELESQFDAQLFDRIGKRLQLNAFGRSLQPQAEELLARAKELEAAFGQRRDSGSLKLGATLSIGNYLAVPMIAKYLELYPDSRVSLDVANTATITKKLEQYELDVALIEGEVNNPDLIITPWRDDNLQVVCAPDHPLALQKVVRDEDLLAASWIVRETGSGTRQTFDRAFHDLLPELHILFELEHTEAIKRAVESGLGLSCLSSITLAEALKRGSLVTLDIPHRNLTRRLYRAIHKQKYMTAAIRQWLTLIEV